MQRFTFCLPHDLHVGARQFAAGQGVSFSAFVSEAVEQKLRAEESLLYSDIANRVNDEPLEPPSS